MKSHLRVDSVTLRKKPGPLQSHIHSFATLLANRGYSRKSIAQRIRLVAALDRWLRQRGMAIKAFKEQRIQQFLRYRRSRYSRQSGDSATLRSLLRHLREIKVIPSPLAKHEVSPLDHLQASFAQYLTEQRGLRPATVKQYLFHTRRFLSQCFGNGALSLGRLNLQDISQCIVRQAKAISPNAAQRMTVALRSLLRFLQQRGDITKDLAKSVPTVANWSYAGLPKYLSPQQVERLLKTCKYGRVEGLRDRAILLLLARLGLRAGEVAHMTLDDIDWQAGELTIRGKGGRQDRLPMPIDVGQSLARYLRYVRPKCASRMVFIRLRAPHQGLGSASAVAYIVRKTLKRAGLNPPVMGAHLLRHSLATRMLRRGASLAEIAEILRHQLLKTTAIYAKVDVTALRTLAQPWPGGEV